MDPIVVTALATVSGAAAATTITFEFFVKRPLGLAPAFLDRFGPAIAILIAFAWAIVGTLLTTPALSPATAVQALLTGMVAGLASQGLYDTLKPAIRAV